MSFKYIFSGSFLLLLNLLVSALPARTTSFDEARIVAENWMYFITERDGQWAGSPNPVIEVFTEFKRREKLLGYYAAVKPRGYIIVSLIRDFAPIKAYSTESNLNPDDETGMCDLLKDVLESRNQFLIEKFGGLDTESLNDLHKFTPDSYHQAWTALSESRRSVSAALLTLQAQAAGPKGPLLKSKWGQGEPFNDDCPAMDCPGAFNHNAKVGCVPLAMAQIMRYYCWPPFFESQYYDWQNMLVNEAHYIQAQNWYNDENGDPWTQAQIDAVADLCYDAGKVLGDIDYGCSSTSAHVCNWYYHDARDAFEDEFYYDTSGNEPDCEDRDEHDFSGWWNQIVNEINHNRPMMYRIVNSDNDFDHAIVVDGYDDSGGQYKAHANYGWSGDWHNNWYDLDWFDCDTQYGWNRRCEWDNEYMIRFIYPRNGLCEWHTGTLGAWGGAGTLQHYIYCDTYSNNLVIQGGARVQFLPGVYLICNGNSISIDSGTQNETRFFTNGIPTNGIKIGNGAKIKLLPNGAIGMF